MINQVKLGRTGIFSPKNAFGALPIQRVDKEYAAKLLNKAYDAGFRFFDTARGYSDSEEKLGYALGGVRHDIIIATKSPAQNAEQFLKDIETSLKTLKTDYLDIVQFHTPPFCPRPGDESGLYDAALEVKKQGKIRHIGISNHRLHVAEEAVRSGLYDTLQFPFSYLSDQKDVDLVKLCGEMDVGFIAMKALSGGLINKSDAAFAWLDQFKNVLPIWGIQRESELDEFISFFENPPVMDARITSIVDKDRSELVGNFCRACSYCMPCPAGIRIFNCARMSQLIRRMPSAELLGDEWREAMFNIENCTECGQCKEKCPYDLNTISLLKANLADYKDILSGKVRI